MPRVDIPEYSTYVDFPDGTPPEEMQTVLSQNFPKKHGILDAFRGAGANVARVINESNAGFLDKLANVVSHVPHDPTEPSAVEQWLRAGSSSAREGAKYWENKGNEAGISKESLAGKIYGGIGSAPMSIAEFSAGVPYAVLSAGPDPVKAVKSGLERFAVGKVFKGLEKANLSPIQRSGAMAGTMAAQTAAEGGSVQDVVAAGLTGLALSAPGESGARSVVRRNLQTEGVQPEIAADLAGRSGTVEPQGPGYITHKRDPNLWSGGEPGRPPVADSEFSPDFGRPAPPVADAENALPAQSPPTMRTGAHPDAVSIEVARLKQEHPYWSDAEYLAEAQRQVLADQERLPLPAEVLADRSAEPVWDSRIPAVRDPVLDNRTGGELLNGVDLIRRRNVQRLTDNQETAPAATDMSTVRPVASGPVRQAEDAPGLAARVPIGNQEPGQRFDGLDRIADPRTPEPVRYNPEIPPTPTDSSIVRPESAPERPAENAPGVNRGPYIADSERFNHDSLPTAAVTAADSLALQNAAPQVKVAVVGTPAEIKALSVAGETKGKVVFQANGKAYVIDPTEARTQFGSIDEAKRMLKAGGGTEARVLGYPAREGVAEPQTAAVTRQGEVLTDPAQVKQAASEGADLEAQGYIPVFRGTGPQGLKEIRPSESGINGEGGVFFYRRPQDAAAYAERGGGIITGYVHPRDAVAQGDVIVLKDAAKLVRRADIPTDRTLDLRALDGIAKEALQPKQVVYAAEGRPEDVAATTQRVSEAIAPAGREGGELNGEGQTNADANAQGGQGRGQEVLNPTGQVDLHAGIHLPTLVKQAKDLYTHYFQKLDPTAPVGSVKSFLDQNRAANDQFGKEPWAKAWRRALIDSGANVQNALMRLGPQGEWVRRQFDAISGASAKAQMSVEQQRELLSGMSLREQQAMGDLIAIDRDLAIAGTGRQGYTYIGGFTPDQLQAARQTFAADYKLTPEEYQRVEQATRKYFDAWKQNTQRMLDAGLITSEQKTALDSQEYSPKQFLEKIDPDSQKFTGLGNRVTVPDSGIKRLKEGSDSYFRNNPMRLLSEATARIETRIARNEANQALAALPEGNGIVEAAKPGSKAPAGYETVSYMENGQQRTLHMRAEYAKEWVQNDPLLNSQLANALQWLTGAKITRALATGYNPAFAVTNIPRDMVTIFMQSDKPGYSQHAPVALGQMLSDMTAVARDAWGRSGRFKDYVNQGGGRELLTHEGALSSRRENLSPVLAKIQKTLSYVNETSELLTRLAYRERLIKNGADPVTASRKAAEYVDFSRGGTVAKAVDRLGIPYLNAAIQGTRSLARAAGRDPGMFAYKTAQLMVGTAGLYAINQMTNPEGWANVSDREKAGNFIIMLPKQFNYTDKDGTDTAMYLKISKEQSMRPFASAAELFTSWANGEKPSVQQLSMALTDALPVSIDKMPPVAAAFWTYALNADTYKKEPVWKGKQEIEPYAEYTQTTNPLFRDFGRLFTSTDAAGVERGGFSPERTKAALEKVLTPSNFYAQMAGNAITDAYEKANPPERAAYEKTTQEQLRSIPGISRLLGGAKDTEQFREGIREARTGTATQQFETNKTLDAMVMRYLKGGQQDAELYKRITDYVGAQAPAVQDRLNGRIEDLVDTANLPDRGWWLSVKSLQPEDRADQFKARMGKAAPDERARMLEIANNLPGFVSDRFMARYESP